MSFAETRVIFGSTQRNAVSRFIAEIPQSLYIPVSMRPAALARSAPTFDPETRRFAPPRWADSIASRLTADLPFKPGDKVAHKVFGRGTVVQITPEAGDAKVSVAFPAPVGIKTLMASFAGLEKT